MTGNSTCGSGATGRYWKARIPANSNPIVNSEVPTGRLMNGDETLKSISRRRLLLKVPESKSREARGQAVEPQVNHWRGVKRQQLAQDQAANNRDAQRMPQLRTSSTAQRQRQSSE